MLKIYSQLLDDKQKDFFDSLFRKEDIKKVVRKDPPKTIPVVLQLYRGMNVDPAKLHKLDNGFVLSPKKSEQGVLWFAHKLITGYDPIEYVQGRGNYVLTYPLNCVRHVQTTYYDDGSDYDFIPNEILDKTEGTENCRYYLGYELPAGWYFSYKTEKFIVCETNITITMDMLSKDVSRE